MGKITDIVDQKKRKDRVSVHIDGVYCCGLDALTVRKNRLKIGDEISEEELSAIQRESEGAAAFDKALKLVSYRSRTKSEVRAYLKEKGYLGEVIAEVMAKLVEYRYVDDFRFCREFVSTYAKRLGKRNIALELKRLGAEAEAIESALESVDGQEEAAFSVAEKYYRTHRKFDLRKMKQYLYTKGFSSDDISSAAARIAEEYDLSGDDDYE